jgi:hypothetical protein
MFHDKQVDKWHMMPWDMDKTLHKDLLNLHYSRSTWSEGLNSNLPDNPIPEFIFINKQMKKDLYNKIKQLTENNFNKNFIVPIIDSLSLILQDYIELDKTDNINTLKEWEQEKSNLIDFIEERPKIVLNQITDFPSSFLVNKANNTLISWTPSTSMDSIFYTVNLCADFNFKEDSVYSFKTKKKDIIIENIPKGTYYYFVTATNQNGTTTGFRIKNKVIVN